MGSSGATRPPPSQSLRCGSTTPCGAASRPRDACRLDRQAHGAPSAAHGDARRCWRLPRASGPAGHGMSCAVGCGRRGCDQGCRVRGLGRAHSVPVMCPRARCGRPLFKYRTTHPMAFHPPTCSRALVGTGARCQKKVPVPSSPPPPPPFESPPPPPQPVGPDTLTWCGGMVGSP